jgi:hypothetical protein
MTYKCLPTLLLTWQLEPCSFRGQEWEVAHSETWLVQQTRHGEGETWQAYSNSVEICAGSFAVP